jgi:hypothetical protein
MINTQGSKKRAGIPSNEVSPDRAEIKNPNIIGVYIVV